jgi:hypothetical protein
MPLTPITLGVRSNPGQTGAISAARMVNAYAQDVGDEGKIRFPIIACDGFEAWSSTFGAISGSGTIRGGFVLSDSAMYVVSGTRIIKLNTSGSPTEITGSITASGLITMARNRKEPNAQIAIASSVGNAFYILENDTLTDLTATITGLGSAGTLQSVTALDGYFILYFDNGEFYITSIDEGSTIDSLEFAKSESNPDGGVKCLTRGRDVVLAGAQSTEFWQNTGAADFPFERVTSADYGCYAAASMVKVTLAKPGGEVADTICMCATDAEGAFAGVVMLNGYSAVKISDAAVDRSVTNETDKTTIRGFARTERGRTFYTLRGSTFTWVFDFSTGFWHERTSDGLAFWRIWNAFTFNGMSIVADYTLAKLYKSLPTLFASGADSVVTLKHSNNNGNSWLVTRTAKTLSGSSNLTQRTKFNRLGQSKEDGKVFNIAISNAVMEDGTGNSMTVQPPAVHAWPNRMRFFNMWIDTIPGGSQTSTPKGITGLAVNVKQLSG